MVTLERVVRTEDEQRLQALIERHLQETGSQKAVEILSGWDQYRPLFWKVVPKGSNEHNLTGRAPGRDVQKAPVGDR